MSIERERAVQTILKVISGGQTGVGRAALDAATACGLPAQRTGRNMREADATLIVTLGELDSGSLTLDVARRMSKPCIVASLDGYPEAAALQELLTLGRPEFVLNVVGPRDSRGPAVYARAFGFLVTLFRTLSPALSPGRGRTLVATVPQGRGRTVVTAFPQGRPSIAANLPQGNPSQSGVTASLPF